MRLQSDISQYRDYMTVVMFSLIKASIWAMIKINTGTIIAVKFGLCAF